MPKESTPSILDNKKSLEKSKALSEFLDKVDFDSLRQILSEYVQASGLTLDKTLFVGKENIVDTKEGNKRGYFYRTKIALNMRRIRELTIETSSPDLIALRILCHEQIHAISKNINEEIDKENFIGKSGYRITTLNTKEEKLKHLFQLFDEGVTEKLGREVAKRYTDLHPDFIGKHQKMRFEFTSPHSVDFVDSFIRRLSKELQLKEETVWHAIIRSKIEGFNFFEKETKEIFEEMFGDKFIFKLANANIKDIRNLTKFIENSPLMPKVGMLDKIRRKIHDLISFSYD